MDQFERQFEPVSRVGWITPTPQVTASRFEPQAIAAATAVQFAPSAPEAPAGEVHAPASALALALTPSPSAGQAPPDPDRKRVLRAFGGILIGLALMLVGAGLVVVLGLLSPVGAGEAETMGVVTSLGSTGGACAPVARFAGTGGSFSTATPVAMSPCPVELGQSVGVVYNTTIPASSGRILVPGLVQQYAWVVPVLGTVVFLASIVIFIIRAGSLGAGIAVIRGGPSRRRRRRGQDQI
jgi:hypothetical protein